MKRTHQRAVLSVALLGGAVLLADSAAAQAPRFRGMDRNRDGVITRAEWRGNEQAFRQHDRNSDGILSGEEVRDTDQRNARPFDRIDLDGNGHITAQEWRRAFSEFDTNRDGSLTEDELGVGAPATAPVVTGAFQAGRDRGLLDGRQAGREDGARRVWDIDGQRELQHADAGYRDEFGPRDQYQTGYREGFRQGYAEGYGPRR